MIFSGSFLHLNINLNIQTKIFINFFRGNRHEKMKGDEIYGS